LRFFSFSSLLHSHGSPLATLLWWPMQRTFVFWQHLTGPSLFFIFSYGRTVRPFPLSTSKEKRESASLDRFLFLPFPCRDLSFSFLFSSLFSSPSGQLSHHYSRLFEQCDTMPSATIPVFLVDRRDRTHLSSFFLPGTSHRVAKMRRPAHTPLVVKKIVFFSLSNIRETQPFSPWRQFALVMPTFMSRDASPFLMGKRRASWSAGGIDAF